MKTLTSELIKKQVLYELDLVIKYSLNINTYVTVSLVDVWPLWLSLVVGMGSVFMLVDWFENIVER